MAERLPSPAPEAEEKASSLPEAIEVPADEPKSEIEKALARYVKAYDDLEKITSSRDERAKLSSDQVESLGREKADASIALASLRAGNTEIDWDAEIEKKRAASKPNEQSQRVFGKDDYTEGQPN